MGQIRADFSSETMQVRDKWSDILKVLREKNNQARILQTSRSKITSRNEGKMKFFAKQQLR